MSESKTYVFGENGTSQGGGFNSILAMLPALMQRQGVDPSLFALCNGKGNGGGWGNDLFAILLLFIIMGRGNFFGGANGGGFMPNGQIANDKNLVVSDNKEAMSAEVDTMLRQSKAILESVDYHKKVVDSCEGMLLQLNPQIAKEREQTEKISKLEGKVSGMEGKLDKMMGLLQQAITK